MALRCFKATFFLCWQRHPTALKIHPSPSPSCLLFMLFIQCVNFSHVIYQPCLFHLLNLNLSLGKVPSLLYSYCLVTMHRDPKGNHVHFNCTYCLMHTNIHNHYEYDRTTKHVLAKWLKSCFQLLPGLQLPLRRTGSHLVLSACVAASRTVWWKTRLGELNPQQVLREKYIYIISRPVKHTTQWIQTFHLSSAVSGIMTSDEAEKNAIYTDI